MFVRVFGSLNWKITASKEYERRSDGCAKEERGRSARSSSRRIEHFFLMMEMK